MNYTLQNIYEDYVEEHGEIDKSLFKDVCEDFNIMIMDYILDGKEFNMGNNLSTLSIVRRDRDPRSPRINWGESNKYKKELLEEDQKLYNSETGEGVVAYLSH